jgi:hypothetical protein
MSRRNARFWRAQVLLFAALLSPLSGYGQQQDQRTSLLSFLSLGPVANALRNARHQDEQRPSLIGPEDHDQKKNYLAAYSALTTLQATRLAYWGSMQLYLTAISGHMPQETIDIRREAFLEQVRLLGSNLKALSSALAPIQISLDLSKPELSQLLSEFEQKRGLTMERASNTRLFETLTPVELADFQAQCAKNNQILKTAISEFRDLLKSKYPDLG